MASVGPTTSPSGRAGQRPPGVACSGRGSAVARQPPAVLVRLPLGGRLELGGQVGEGVQRRVHADQGELSFDHAQVQVPDVFEDAADPAVYGISDSVLSDRLTELATAGLVHRVVPEGPPVRDTRLLLGRRRRVVTMDVVVQG
jgi:hypothetical protein